jgi:hypothetical protein
MLSKWPNCTFLPISQQANECWRIPHVHGDQRLVSVECFSTEVTRPGSQHPDTWLLPIRAGSPFLHSLTGSEYAGNCPLVPAPAPPQRTARPPVPPHSPQAWLSTQHRVQALILTPHQYSHSTCLSLHSQLVHQALSSPLSPLHKLLAPTLLCEGVEGAHSLWVGN